MVGPAKDDETLVHDESAPEFEGSGSTQAVALRQSRRPSTQTSAGNCLVEQVAGRHWSDPAFLIEAPFYDPESLLDVKFTIGTFPDGTDVLDWSQMDGCSQVRNFHEI